ncbi:hypothetical protein HDG34_003262 [Paraburkholderia sp. HC6.4b]|uniref:hypothetical protein n=1 Tax=unclassified Paraburkholderia TaxID=2615204 RepID=UPI00160866E0|nr:MULTISPECIES: hypothetical protein [unclassified Paraburkholderia]MBB5409321.1 hypothetical protein [Paraburkholderia sp. HC6.4b]MBB5451049.1 hypothetical protein [Paraburkholderia sp. Kb1A]
MAKNIEGVFAEACHDLVIDAMFARRISQYRHAFVFKNADHIKFFGGNLTGVEVVRFTDDDRDRWFEEILKVEEGVLAQELVALPTVNPTFKVSSDTMNLSCAWLMHTLYASPKLNDTQKQAAMMDVGLVLQYKFLTSRLFRHFRYPADRATAEATYALLSGKFAIKQYGTWNAVLEQRTRDLISPQGLHFKAISKMDNDLEVIYLLNDTQSRIRDMLKNIYDVFLQVHHQGMRIQSSSALVDYDGEVVLKDRNRNLLAYTRYLQSIVSDRHSFIKEELLELICKLMYTTPPRLFRQTLEWISDNYRQARAKRVGELLDETLIHSFDYLAEERTMVRTHVDLPTLLARLRGVYTSSRSIDPALFSLREKAEWCVKQATGNRNDSVIASVRTAVLLYLVIRTMTMRHYTGS